MKTEIKARDRILLVVACSALIVVLMFRLAILPTVDAYEAKSIEYDEKNAQAEKMQKLLDDRPANEKRISEGKARLKKLSGDCYEVMENRKIDELVTGIVLDHKLFPSHLSISEQTTGISEAYLYSSIDSDSEAAAGSGTENEAAGEAADGTLSDAEAETAETSEETAGGGVCSVDASIVMSGSESNMKAFLDDIEENYPAVHVKSFEMAENLYMNKKMQPVTEIQMKAVLRIYMYNRPGKQ